ncbi:hypothetical protein M3N64_10135 [Sporolactobacillus sp. CPB3-1]|uniref:DegT/DnrJ/EryC1/StrS aminotransferase family protein n=1 Tax=Sporolactobacillus mangiferae TaxID=2940498 RepID=A0ABT0MBP5_9BACL|nr:hypothetical protein [Sporolactobacillus mangiferae]MCL1632296.1 hypothetical protein [Sporolactobacillus mangiferae]
MAEQKAIIGGFFSLELPEGTEYHDQALHLNSARYGLEYVLRVRGYKKIYLPAYICDSVLQPIRRLHVAYAFYRIDENFAPIFDHALEDGASFLYVNYFGINGSNSWSVCQNLKAVIIDNTHAFFERPLPGIDTLYSPRKFFGVPDGGYLYTNAEKPLILTPDPSYYRFDALLKQIDLGSVAAEPLFEQNEAYLNTCGMHAMAHATQRLLKSIDSHRTRKRRNTNFRFLHEQIGRFNQLHANFSELNGPLCYPFLIEQGKQLKERLLQTHIFINDYWEEVASRVPASSFECYLSENLVALPIDQRYGKTEMQVIAHVVKDFLA